jgi:uncharacterized BrkB/YihY/UPF0761 family membrane protein
MLSKTEIVVHGLADGAATMVLLSSLADYLKSGDLSYLLVHVSLSLLVILLSLLIVARRLRPENRRLRGPEILLSVLVAAVGAVAAVLLLAFLVSGATYKGDSPDAGGMAVVFSLFLYYPAAALVVLPLALKVSRLSPRLRRGLGWMVLLLVLLPFIVLTGARAAGN